MCSMLREKQRFESTNQKDDLGAPGFALWTLLLPRWRDRAPRHYPAPFASDPGCLAEGSLDDKLEDEKKEQIRK